jgi:outer membrane protein assembly factor BamB
LYAFDADAPPPDAFVWQQGLHGELGTPGFCARNIAGPNGILSTPVIDKAHGHVYVVARDCDPQFAPEMPRCKHRLFQVALATGEVLQSVAIEGEAQGVTFDPSAHWNRPGLTLQDDALIVAFGSGPAGQQHEEDFVYHGWAFRFRVSDLSHAPEVYCTTPHGRGGSVWQSGAAPAADERGVYLTGANGIQADSKTHPPAEWPTTPVGQEDNVVRLSHEPWTSSEGALKAYWDDRDYIQQGNVFQHMESGDNGFGSSGPLLIPDTRLLLVGTKAGLVYLLDRDSMKSVQEPLSPFTDLPLQPGHKLYLHSWWGIPMITQTFVFFRPDADHIAYAYAWASNDRLRQLRFDYNTQRVELAGTADVPDVLGGGNMVLSAAGDAADSGVLWAVTRSGDGTGGPDGVLWAFDPRTLKQLWKTQTPAWSKFNPPTVIRGRVLVPSTAPGEGITQQVLVYGLKN